MRGRRSGASIIRLAAWLEWSVGGLALKGIKSSLNSWAKSAYDPDHSRERQQPLIPGVLDVLTDRGSRSVPTARETGATQADHPCGPLSTRTDEQGM